MLETYGVDINEIIRARRVTFALVLIDGLPAASRYRQAVLTDPQAAREIVRWQDEQEQAGVEPEPYRVQISENTAEVILLTRLLKAVDGLHGLLLGHATQGKRKHKPAPLPTPETAVEKERDRLAREKSKELQNTFLPHN